MGCGFVVLKCRLVVIHFVEAKERGIRLVLNDIEPAAPRLVQNRAGAIFDRCLNKTVNVSLHNFEPNHEDIHGVPPADAR